MPEPTHQPEPPTEEQMAAWYRAMDDYASLGVTLTRGTVFRLIREVRRLRPMLQDALERLRAENHRVCDLLEAVEQKSKTIAELKDDAQQGVAEVARLREGLGAIRDYEPSEVAKDEFAYDRMIGNYRDAATAALEGRSDGPPELNPSGRYGRGRNA